MNKITKNVKPKIIKPNRVKIKKPNPILENTIKKGEILEKTPKTDYLDFSTEELGYFTRRNKETNKILEVIYTIFPR